MILDCLEKLDSTWMGNNTFRRKAIANSNGIKPRRARQTYIEHIGRKQPAYISQVDALACLALAIVVCNGMCWLDRNTIEVNHPAILLFFGIGIDCHERLIVH